MVGIRLCFGSLVCAGVKWFYRELVILDGGSAREGVGAALVTLRESLVVLHSPSTQTAPPDPIPILPGIINPIEAKQRKGKGAVGAYGSERTTQSLQDFPVVDSEEEAEEVFLGFLLFPCSAVCTKFSFLNFCARENCLGSY